MYLGKRGPRQPQRALLHLIMVQEELSDFCEHRSDMEVAKKKKKKGQPNGAMKIRARIISSGDVYGPLM